MVQDNNKRRHDRTSSGLILILVVALTAGFVGLSAIGANTLGYVLFVTGPSMTTLIGVVLSRRVASVAVVVDEVREQTNGIASAQTAAVQAHLTEQDVTAADVAMDATVDRQRHADKPPGSPVSGQPTGP